MPVEIKPEGLDTSDKAVRERYEDSFHQLYVIHKLRWNLNLIFADVGDTDEYIDAILKEAFNVLEKDSNLGNFEQSTGILVSIINKVGKYESQ